MHIHTFPPCSGLIPYLHTFLLVCLCLPPWAAMVYTPKFPLLVPKGYLSFLIHRTSILLTLPPAHHPTHHSALGRWALPGLRTPCTGGRPPKPSLEKGVVPPNQWPSWKPHTLFWIPSTPCTFTYRKKKQNHKTFGVWDTGKLWRAILKW